jgi:hypothetical protein
MNAFGCTLGMVVPPTPCDADAPPRQLFLQEEDTWISWRLGTSAVLMLTPRLKLTGDVAYLPIVRFSGVDNHPLRVVRARARAPRLAVTALACSSRASSPTMWSTD